MPLIAPQDLAKAARPKARRGTYYVQTWGCQMNDEDSEQLGLRLESIGFAPAASIHEAHVILLNTCSVRKKPEDKAFSLLGELAALKARRPEVILGVCGCMAQLRAEEIHKRAPHVDFVVGTGQIEAVPGLVEEAAQGRKFQMRLGLPERSGAVVTEVPGRVVPGDGARVFGCSGFQVRNPDHLSIRTPEDLNTRVPEHLSTRTLEDPPPPPKLKAFVPIQYGCDKFCTFCIVPTTRGRERSRPTEDVVREVRLLAAMGTKEVTLLGQTVNSYGKNLAEGRVPFSKLLWLLDGIPGLERIRYTSPYPRDFKEDLIACIRECPKVMEHVHLPLQSGDDEVLKAMKRVYTVGSFLEIVSALRRAVPGIALTTDIIVGFPGETDEQFKNTLDIIRNVRFDGAFMFVYSPRPGTPAASMPQVPAQAKKERLNALVELQNGITCEINAGYVGRELEVLVEGPSPKDPAMLQGYSREFKMVHFPGAPRLAGQIVKVEAVEARLWGLRGKLVAEP